LIPQKEFSPEFHISAVSFFWCEQEVDMEIKILVAEDDPIFRQLIDDILTQKGYSVVGAANGKEALEKFFSVTDIALCILDVMMPIYDGWQVLEEIRLHSEVPVLMLTALADEKNEVRGLSSGADDYIGKPFSYPIFIARIEALLRKVRKKKTEGIKSGEITIEQGTHQVWSGDQEIKLNHKEYSLLIFLVKNQGIVLGRETILNHVWGYNFEGDIRTIDAHIKMLRNKLGDSSDYIKTVRGTGYLFEVCHEKEHS
jgi:DNA-binding response OmpR family regulator